MNGMKKVAIGLTIAMSISTVSWAAPVYKDVPNWAADAVEKVVDKGLMVGNMNGEFDPYVVIDKFEMVNKLAKLAGYKDELVESLTAEEKKYINDAYTKNKGFIDLYKNGFTRWNSSETTNKKIAFLIEKGVLLTEDMNQFVIKSQNGSETIVSLKREDLAVYLTRLLGKKETALALGSNTGFADDGDISANSKPYINYMKSIGIFKGDSNNKFNPKDPVTKVTMAIVLANILDYTDQQNTPIVNTPTQPSTGTTTPVVTNPSTVNEPAFEAYMRGEILQLHLDGSMKVIRVEDEEGVTKYYELEDDAKIWNGKTLVTKNDLEVNMLIYAHLVSESKVDRIDIISRGTTVEEPEEEEETPVEEDDVVKRLIQGTVDSIKIRSDQVILTVKVQYAFGGEYAQEYIIDKNATFIENDKDASIDDIEEGDLITAEVSSKVLYEAEILSKQQNQEGKIVEKKYSTSENILVIELENGDVVEYKVASNVSIDKDHLSKPTLSDLRVGDEVEFSVEYNTITDLTADSSSGTEKGIVNMIEISGYPKIGIITEDGEGKEYWMLPTVEYDNLDRLIGIYDLRLGDEVKLYLDSEEVEKVIVYEQEVQTRIQGYIEEVIDDGDEIIVRIGYNDSGNSAAGYLKQYSVSSSVDIYDGSKKIDRDDLDEGMQIYMTFDEDNTQTLEAIYILSK